MTLYTQMIKTLKTLVIAVAAISLAACTGTQNNTQDTTSPSPSPTTEAQAPNTSTITAADVTFKKLPEGQVVGYLDTVNESNELKQSLAPNTPITLSGWAVLPDASKPADMVIITTGADNAIVLTAPVNIDRTDVAESLKNPNLAKSGWAAQIESAKLSGDKITLQAWAYNSTTKEAYPLGNTYEIAFK